MWTRIRPRLIDRVLGFIEEWRLFASVMVALTVAMANVRAAQADQRVESLLVRRGGAQSHLPLHLPRLRGGDPHRGR